MHVSFVIPAYNEEGSIAECIRCIQKALAVCPVEAEIIVVDNASTDSTSEIAGAIAGVTVVYEPRQSLTQARKTGFEASTGELIVQVDADNRMPEQWLEVALRTLKNKPRATALTGRAVYFDLPKIIQMGILWVYYVNGYIASRLLYTLFRRGTIFQGGNCIIRRAALIAAGGYNTAFPFYGEDVELGARLQKVGPVYFRFGLPMNTSGRRLAAEGIFTMALRYGLNYVWTILLHRPYTQSAPAIRTVESSFALFRLSPKRLMSLSLAALFLALSGGVGLAVHHHLEAEKAAASSGAQGE